MGCSSCSSNNGLPGGCKNNGACGTYGCNKLDVFDWLAGMAIPDAQKLFDIVEIRFKNSRKGFYRNTTGHELFVGDVVAVESSPGHDVGVVSLTGELVRIQMKRKEVKDNYEIKKVYRKAKEEDITKWQEGRKLEQDTMMRARTIARELGLSMKISDVEYQGDKAKATFYYTADDRVDFRELIRRYAEAFKVKIEMRQIGLRLEAGRLGGIGSCGRELCCSTWLTDFRAVSTSAARYQQLSLNPSKLAGQCGKLKCCLNYELDQYVEAIKDLPSTNTRLKLPKGVASHLKTDIFKRVMYFVYDGQPTESPIMLSVDAVREIQEMNLKGIAIEDVDDFTSVEDEVVEETDFAQVVGQDSLTRFDRKRNPKGRSGKNRGHGGKGSNYKPMPAGKEGNTENPQQENRQKPQHRQGNNRPNQPQQKANQPGGNPPQKSTNQERSQGGQRPPQKPRNEGNQAPKSDQAGKPRPEGGQPKGDGQQRRNNPRPQRPQNRDNRPKGTNPSNDSTPPQS